MERRSFWRLAWVAVLTWLCVIGFDFLLHASVLAPLYAEPNPFLLPPDQAFALIPIGYLSFLIYIIMLIWLIDKLNIGNWKEGFVFGIIIGALMWGALTLSLISITTAPLIMMAAWFIGQTLEAGIAGLVISAGLGAEKLRSILIWVLLFAFGSFVIGVLLQNL